MLIPYADDNPTLRVPYVTLGIIAVNVLVFAYQISLPEEAAYEFVRAFAFVPGELYGFLPPGPAPIPDYLTLVTSMLPESVRLPVVVTVPLKVKPSTDPVPATDVTVPLPPPPAVIHSTSSALTVTASTLPALPV